MELNLSDSAQSYACVTHQTVADAEIDPIRSAGGGAVKHSRARDRPRRAPPSQELTDRNVENIIFAEYKSALDGTQIENVNETVRY
ncbi:hypothetical protein J6590_035360 [Homalodisca vitripennis]|nr:hypothetical protein J6590_035360 [Homalodisca vitripennis]